jgi:molybdenum cofactor cytidylyltransferase
MSANRLACIVLAAGGASRFGSTKQLQAINGRSLVARAVTAAIDSGAQLVIVVTGARADEVEEKLIEFPSVLVVRNSDWESGIASSIAAGIRAIAVIPDVDGIMITLGDQPLVDDKCLKRLAERFDGDNRVVASSYSGTVGAPVIIGREYAPDLISLEGDRGAGAWIKARMNEVTIVDMPEAAFDIDAPEDLPDE